MLNNKFLMLGTMSVLLTTTVFGAGTEEKCVGGVCYVNLNNLNPSRTIELKKQKIEEHFEINEIDTLIPIILNGELISVFPSYTMVDAKTFPLEDEIIILQNIQTVENTILGEVNLPTTEYFCDNDKLPMYEKDTDIYVCV